MEVSVESGADPGTGGVRVRRQASELHGMAAVLELISRRYAEARSRLVGAAGGLVLRSETASASRTGAGPGEDLLADSLDLQAHIRLDAGPFPRYTVVCLHEGRYAVGRGGGLRHVARGQSVLFVPGARVTTICDQVRYQVVGFPAGTVGPIAGRLGVDAADLRFEGTRPVSAAMNRHWRATSAYLFRSFAGPDPPVGHPLILAGVLEAVASAVLVVFPNTTMRRDHLAGPGRTAPATVRRAVAFIDAHAAEPITLEGIAAAAGISVRGLQAAFARHRDTTPSGYLRRVRLEGAHRDLQAADPTRGDTVAEIARRWGFPHPGRFSAVYRDAFGRPPKRTLHT
ncbi:hypothetical protein GCM10010468_48620 [Actinocorallia longicatena]|uniref:HTH araC/xylS-type domain-containing protein n=1 Tax=Actinocorallia longicatena TaxID=111803 RepID=A0ABP6QDP9_9ACTN